MSDIWVVKEQLGEFSKKAGEQAEDAVSTTTNEAHVSMLMEGTTALGQSAFPSGNVAFATHWATVDQFGQFASHLAQGLMALQFGAQTIQNNYTAADDESASGMKTVQSAFQPGEGQMSLQEMIDKARQKPPAAAGEGGNGKSPQLPDPTDYSPNDYTPPIGQGEAPSASSPEDVEMTLLNPESNPETELPEPYRSDYETALRNARLSNIGGNSVI